MAGWQNSLHGLSKEELAQARNGLNADKPSGNWFGKWVPEGPLSSETGDWKLLYTIPPEATIKSGFYSGFEVRGIFSRTVTHEQFGHFEFLGRGFKSFTRTWTTTQLGNGPVQVVPLGPSHQSMLLYDKSKIKEGLYWFD